jgi:hypothetical protein
MPGAAPGHRGRCHLTCLGVWRGGLQQPKPAVAAVASMIPSGVTQQQTHSGGVPTTGGQPPPPLALRLRMPYIPHQNALALALAGCRRAVRRRLDVPICLSRLAVGARLAGAALQRRWRETRGDLAAQWQLLASVEPASRCRGVLMIMIRAEAVTGIALCLPGPWRLPAHARLCMYVHVYVCVRERERARERVRERESARERERVCVCERESARARETHRERERERERERVGVCVCVCVRRSARSI